MIDDNENKIIFHTMIVASLVFGIAAVTTNTFLIQSAFAQQNPIPSPDGNAYIHACINRQPTPPNVAFCIPA